MRERLEEIKYIRSRNNDLWMEILEIALTHAPDETRAVLRHIRIGDMLVSKQVGKLLDEDSQADNLP
jgi:hypothetical protein